MLYNVKIYQKGIDTCYVEHHNAIGIHFFDDCVAIYLQDRRFYRYDCSSIIRYEIESIQEPEQEGGDN